MSNILVKIPAVIGPTMPINRMLTDMNLPYLWCLRVKRASNPAGTWKKREDTSAHRNTPYHISTRESKEGSQITAFPSAATTERWSWYPVSPLSKPFSCKVGSSVNYPDSDSFRGIGKLQSPPVFVQKVLLDHSHAHSFKSCLLAGFEPQGQSWNSVREHMACKAWNINYLAFHRKRWAIPDKIPLAPNTEKKKVHSDLKTALNRVLPVRTTSLNHWRGAMQSVPVDLPWLYDYSVSYNGKL